MEIIFCLKDLLSNTSNYGWLDQSKKLLIIDFSIDKDKINQANSTSMHRMVHAALPDLHRVPMVKLAQKYTGAGTDSKKLFMRRAIEPLSNSFLEALDIATQSMNDFIDSFPFAFNDRTKEMTRSRLEKFSQYGRARFNDLLTYLDIKKD
jgi:hypothetical protein